MVSLITTQCFLDTAERTLFANNTQDYLIKEVYEEWENFFSSDKNIGSFFAFWKWHKSIRLNRFFKKII